MNKKTLQKQAGIVLANHGNQVEVESDDGNMYVCHTRRNAPPVVCGDKVLWESDEHGMGIIVKRLPRQTELIRSNQRDSKTLLANIDTMLIVIAAKPVPSSQIVDTYLVCAHSMNIKPIILLNKVDLEETPALALENYEKLEISILKTSTVNGTGMQRLSEALTNTHSLLVGQSGVGKSSLINYCVPNKNIQIQSLSESTETGRQTTSTVRLYRLPLGGYILDSPGTNYFNINHFSNEEIFAGFTEFAPYKGQCKFRDCSHQHEPDCALKAALEKGEIAPERLANFITLSKL